MPADRPRAYEYRGDGSHYRKVRGQPYIRRGGPLTPDDIPLAPPVEVTEEDVDFALTVALNKRLAARQEGE